MKEHQRLTIGQKVTWTSSASGTTKSKTGEIVAIVPANEALNLSGRLGDDFNARYKDRTSGGLWHRKHESYIVSVPAKTKRGKPRLYWPVVSLLRAVEEGKVASAPSGE